MASTFSKDACYSVIRCSDEAFQEISTNIDILDNEVNSAFANLQDPVFDKYLELSDIMQEKLVDVCKKLDGIADYCERVIRWITEYEQL